MNEAHLLKLVLQEQIALLPPEEQDKVNTCAFQIRQAVKAGGEHGTTAFALVSCEISESA